MALDRARLFGQEREAREALERADTLKSQFVALAAHELRSPVGAIYGLSETIAQRRDELGPEQLEQLQATLTAQIRRMRDLVEQLLDLSRLEAAAVEIKPERVRVRDRLEEIVESAAPMQAGRIGIEADPGLEADVDFAALDRIVSNLVVNACRYGEPPVTVSAERDHGLLRVDRAGPRRRRAGGVHPAAFRPFRPQRRERDPVGRDGPRPRDRALLRPRAPRRRHLQPGATTRRGLRADAARAHGCVAVSSLARSCR